MAKENKKVINAKEQALGEVKFKSTLELSFYRILKESRLTFEYECQSIKLLEAFYPSKDFIIPKNKELAISKTKVRDVTYTPDFVIFHNGFTFYIEAKGFKTDAYNIKVKFFRRWLETQDRVVFFEIKTQKQLKQAIEIIQNYEKGNNNPSLGCR